MRTGSIYVYYDPVDLHCVYVGSTQDGNVMRRHREHEKESKSIGPWLRKIQGLAPITLEQVSYENVSQLYARENFWMKELKTLSAEGGFNCTKAGGLDRTILGHIGNRQGKSLGGKLGAQNQPREAKVLGGKIGWKNQPQSSKVLGREKGRHIRWHERRGLKNSNCELCQCN